MVLLEPGDRNAPDTHALPAHRLDEDRLVRHQPGDWMSEARILLAVTGVHRSLDPPPVAHPGIQRFQGRALERPQQLLGHVIADDRHEAAPVLAQEPGPPVSAPSARTIARVVLLKI